MNEKSPESPAADAEHDAVELHVRRIIDTEGLALSRQILLEAEKYRQSLESQFRHIMWLIGIVATAGAALLVFFFGRSYNDLSEQLRRGIEEETVKYAIVKKYQDDLEGRIGVFESQATGKIRESIDVEKQKAVSVLTNTIEAEKQKLMNDIRNQITSEVSQKIETIVNNEVTKEELQQQWRSLDNLIGRVNQLETTLFPGKGFLTGDQIVAILQRSVLEPDERVEHKHLVFSTDTQHTWIMSSKSRLFIYLDDENTRTDPYRALLQNTPASKTDVKSVSATERSNSDAGELDLGLKPGYITLYSQSLFPNPVELERLVNRMLSKAEDQELPKQVQDDNN